MWEMDALRCKCTGCEGCSEWLSDGPGCRQKRAKSERFRKPEDMMCFACAAFRDEAITSTQGKGAGKGQSSTGSGAAASTHEKPIGKTPIRSQFKAFGLTLMRKQ